MASKYSLAFLALLSSFAHANPLKPLYPRQNETSISSSFNTGASSFMPISPNTTTTAFTASVSTPHTSKIIPTPFNATTTAVSTSAKPVGPETSSIASIASTTSTGLPIPSQIPDGVIAYQEVGCNTNGSGPAYGWFNFAPNTCQSMFPDPQYSFASLWVYWGGGEYKCCTVTIYSGDYCDGNIDGFSEIPLPWGECMDAADSKGKSFYLDCY